MSFAVVGGGGGGGDLASPADTLVSFTTLPVCNA
jgi:hypothetical protein